MQGRQLRAWSWVDVCAAVASVLVLAVTAIYPTWIESVFGLDPDAGSGAVEWWIAALAVGVAVGSSLLARAELRRGRTGQAR
jgi:hypothetical protein